MAYNQYDCTEKRYNQDSSDIAHKTPRKQDLRRTFNHQSLVSSLSPATRLAQLLLAAQGPNIDAVSESKSNSSARVMGWQILNP
jgi:hypothetical protein